jgi:hypothetical protein
MRIQIKDEIMTIHFESNREKMNQLLDPISNEYEGFLSNRMGHNFPSSYIPKKHLLYKYKDQCKYVIGVYNSKSIKHELLHAKYYINADYREEIDKEWESMSATVRNHIQSFLRRLGYSEKVIVDEYQAYRYSEAPNFFGIEL